MIDLANPAEARWYAVLVTADRWDVHVGTLHIGHVEQHGDWTSYRNGRAVVEGETMRDAACALATGHIEGTLAVLKRRAPPPILTGKGRMIVVSA